MMRAALLLVLCAGVASESSFTLQVGDEVGASPSKLSEEYAKQLPKISGMIPKDTIREHIRRDLMPRLVATEDGRTVYELALNIFEKLSGRSTSLLQLEKTAISSDQASDLKRMHKDISADIELMATKIKEGQQGADVSNNVLQLLANSAKAFSCAFKTTERALVLKNLEDPKMYEEAFLSHKHPCNMPFPGSLIMLGQTITVPKELDVILPAEGDSMRLKPQEWMSEHLQRKLWCPDSFRRVGFGRDAICEAVASALDMPRSGELSMERAILLQVKGATEQGAAMPKATVQTDSMAKVAEQKEVQPGSLIQTQLAENQKSFEELHKKEMELGAKLSLQQKKQRLMDLKERLAANKAKLALV